MNLSRRGAAGRPAAPLLALLVGLLATACSSEAPDPAAGASGGSPRLEPRHPAASAWLEEEEVPLSAAVQRIADAGPHDPWEANLHLARRLPDEEVLALLRAHRARPYALYGYTRWDHRLGAGPRAASESLLPALRRGALRRARALLCDPALADTVAVPGDPQAVLAELIAAEEVLRGLEAGEPLVHALRITAPAAELRRLAADPRVAGLRPAVRVSGIPVLPEIPVPDSLRETALPPGVEGLSESAMRTAIRRVAERAPCERPAY